MSEKQADYDTDAGPTHFASAPWSYTDTHLESDPDAGWAEATVWDSTGDLVCAVSTQLAGDGTLETAADRARLIAAAGSAAHELDDQYDPVAAAGLSAEMIEVLEDVFGMFQEPSVPAAECPELLSDVHNLLSKARRDNE